MIAIKDLKMPKCCAICYFYYMHNGNLEGNDIEDETISFRCMADLMLRRAERKYFYKQRHKTCPLIEIKEKKAGKNK